MKIPQLLGILLAMACLVPAAASAQNAREMRRHVEGSMLVTGSVDIDREGRVTAHALDQSDRLPAYVVALVTRAVPALRFEPVLVDGAPALARAKMSLRLVATPAEGGDMHVAIRSASFGDQDAPDDTDRVLSLRMNPPRYPQSVAMVGGKGTVYLLVKVDRDGQVEDVVAEQTNLAAVGTARQMESIRRALEQSALGAAKQWTFVPPSTGEQADRPHWVIRVPVEFTLIGDRDRDRDRYGQWAGYVPGPRTRPVWALPDPPGFSPDTLAAGGVHPGQSRFRLLTPLEG